MNGLDIAANRVCNECLAAKPLAEFAPDLTGWQGRRRICRACYRAKQSARHAQRKSEPAYKAALVINRRRSDLSRKYGITEPEYLALLASQGNACAICCTQPNGQRLAVDHDHTTGKVRGLLCGHCNKALGLFGDDADRLRKAAEYVG